MDRGNQIFKVSKSSTNGVVELYNNSERVSSWILKTMDLPITNDLSVKLNQLSPTECPQKLKEAKATKLTFAAQVENEHLIAIKRTVIYSYLPTKAVKGFPFLINGDFLTNAERTELMPNIWNEFLFTEIARRQLEWFRDLQHTEFRYDVLKLLNGKYPVYSASNIDKIYNTSIEEAAHTVDFLPEQSNNEYKITIANSIVDTPQFSGMFSPSIITDYLDISETHGIVDLRLEGQTAITALGAIPFTFSQLLELIAAGAISDTIGATNLIVFFYNKTINNKNPSWLTQLEGAAFIMDESGHYKTPKEIFIPSQDNENLMDVNFENLSYVHSDILSYFDGKVHIMDWLQNLGVREPTDLEVVKKALIPLIQADGVNEQNALNITRFIFNVYQAKVLSDQDYDNLMLLKLFTEKGLKTPTQCYLSDRYGPERKLSAIIPNANFLSDSYIENEEDISEWKGFFKKIGVRENISIDLIEDKTERQSFERLYPESKQYFTWLENENAFSDIYHSYRYTGQHYIQNFTAIEFRTHLSGFDFSKFFWGKMLDGWDVFRQKCNITHYYYRGGSNIVPSFVQYYAKNFPSIPCTDGKCYKSVEVFSPSLKSIIGNYLPVADLTTSITIEQTEFFAFKRTISVSECLDLLDKISTQTQSSDLNKQIFAIYDQLIGQSSSNEATVRTRITPWRKKGKILAINNTFQYVKDLYIFSVYSTGTPVNSERFVKLPANRSFDEIRALADFLNIPVITFDLLEFVADGEREEKALQNALIKRARFLALIYAHNSGENYFQVLSRLSTILKSTRFLQAEKLNLIYKLDDGEVIINSKIDAWNGKSSEFYFTGKWNSPLTLYGLSNSICALLDIKNMEREFGLIIQLTEEDIYQWLQEKGYKVEELSEKDLFFDDISEDFEVINIDEENLFTGIDIDVFVEKIKVSEIDFTNIVPVVKDFTGAFISPAKEYIPIENQQVKIDIGRWSEEYVFKYFKENPEIYSSVKWLNQSEESYLPYDFEVVENGVTKFIEVKGTSSLTKEIVFVSEAEWQVLFKQGLNYSIFRVFGAGTSINRFERTDDLQSLLSAGKLLSFPIQLIIP